MLVSEDLATRGIRAHLVVAKGNGDPWMAGKNQDYIEEFGYGGAPVRIKSDQERTDTLLHQRRSTIYHRQG